MSGGAPRRWLVRLAPWFGLLAACSSLELPADCDAAETGCPANTPQYEQNIEHAVAYDFRPGQDVENVTVASGVASASAAARAGLDTLPDEDQVPAAVAIDAERGVVVRYASASPPKTADSDPFTDHFLVTCTYDVQEALPAEAPATCTGTATWTLAAALRPGGAGVVAGGLQLAAQRIAAGGDAFDAAVTFSCGEWSDPPNVPVPVRVDAGFRRVGALPAQSVDCRVAVTIDSAALAAGRTVHQLLVTARSARRRACSSDAGCAGGDRCSSSNLQCTSGLNGAACLSPYDPETGNGDCSAEAPFCTPLGCSTGLAGRPCGLDASSASDVYCAEGLVCVVGGGFPSCQPQP
jgi:hypothetical protein